MEEVVGHLKTHEDRLRSYGEQVDEPSCYLLMSSGHHDPKNPTRRSRQAPQRRAIVMEVEAKDEGVIEEVDVNPMKNRMTTRRIKAK